MDLRPCGYVKAGNSNFTFWRAPLAQTLKTEPRLNPSQFPPPIPVGPRAPPWPLTEHAQVGDGERAPRVLVRLELLRLGLAHEFLPPLRERQQALRVRVLLHGETSTEQHVQTHFDYRA